MRQNCSASLNFSDTVGQKCYSPHNFFDSVGETANWTLEKFGTVRRNFYSLPKNWYKTVIHLWNFSKRWDILVIQRSKFSALWDKSVIHLILFSTLRQNCKLTFKIQLSKMLDKSVIYLINFRRCEKKMFLTLKIFATARRNCYSPHELLTLCHKNVIQHSINFGTVRQNCYAPHKINDAVGQNCNWTLKFMALWDKIITHLISFSTLAEKIVIQPPIFSALRYK